MVELDLGSKEWSCFADLSVWASCSALKPEEWLLSDLKLSLTSIRDELSCGLVCKWIRDYFLYLLKCVFAVVLKRIPLLFSLQYPASSLTDCKAVLRYYNH